MYTTMCACVAALCLFVVRFEFPIEKIFSYALISVVFLVVLISIASALALVVRKILKRSRTVEFDYTQYKSDNNNE